MSDFRKPDRDEIDSRRFEEVVYEQVAKEIEEGTRKPGLWAKAIADSDGETERAAATYIKLRAQALLDEAYLYREDAPVRDRAAAEQRQAEAEAQHKADREHSEQAREIERQDAEKARHARLVKSYAGQLLFDSCRSCDKNGVLQGLAMGIPVDVRDVNGRTPLLIAAESGCLAIVHFLLDVGASSLSSDFHGNLAQDLAQMNGHDAVAAFLETRPPTRR